MSLAAANMLNAIWHKAMMVTNLVDCYPKHFGRLAALHSS